MHSAYFKLNFFKKAASALITTYKTIAFFKPGTIPPIEFSRMMSGLGFAKDFLSN
jgi:hypothetical protein